MTKFKKICITIFLLGIIDGIYEGIQSYKFKNAYLKADLKTKIELLEARCEKGRPISCKMLENIYNGYID